MDDTQPKYYKLRDDPFMRFCAFYAFLYLGSLMLGGTGIFLIVFGLMLFFTRVFARITIGQTYIRRFFGFKQPDQIVTQNHSQIYKIATISMRLILFGFYSFVGIFMIWMGIKQLLEYGFLNQNLIYILFLEFK